MEPLIDDYNRRINYLRIFITDRCNLRCVYCMPPQGVEKLKHGEILTYEEILRVVTVAAAMGVEKVRLTGGEPLLKEGIFDLFAVLLRANDLTSIVGGYAQSLERVADFGLDLFDANFIDEDFYHMVNIDLAIELQVILL